MRVIGLARIKRMMIELEIIELERAQFWPQARAVLRYPACAWDSLLVAYSAGLCSATA